MQTKTLALILAIASTALAQTPNVQFRAAQQKETVDGDMNAAIKLYRQVADGKSTPPALAARALVRLGQCYERLGSTEAAKAYERVVTQFGKEETAAEARQRLASLPGKGGGKSPEASLVTRKVAGDLPWIQNTLTRDGRYTLVKPGLGLDLFDLVTGSRKPIRGAPLVSAGEHSRGPLCHFAGWPAVRLCCAPPRDARCSYRWSGIRTLASLPGKLKIQPFDWSDDGHTILAAPFSRTPPRTSSCSWIPMVRRPGHSVSGNIGGQARFSPDKQWISSRVRRKRSTIAVSTNCGGGSVHDPRRWLGGAAVSAEGGNRVFLPAGLRTVVVCYSSATPGHRPLVGSAREGRLGDLAPVSVMKGILSLSEWWA